ncbi:MAG: F0F1 ATP synthase subunit B [Planctomycetota bacterium]
MTILNALAGSLITVASEEGFNPIRISDASNTLWTIVIFALSLPFMWKFVWGPMARALHERDHHAEEAVKAAEAAKAAAENAKNEVEKRLADATKESARMIVEARSMGEAQARDVIAQAQTQSQQILDRAKSEIEREKSKALAEIRETVVDISIDAATKVVGRAVGDDDQRRYVREFVASQQ